MARDKQLGGSLAYILGCLLICSQPSQAQSSGCASVSRTGDEVTLTAEFWRPLRVIGNELVDHYGINLSVEDPQWAYPIDTEDVAVADPRFSAEHHNVHYQLMKRHLLQLRFSVNGKGGPTDTLALLQQLVDAANREMPYAYRLDADKDAYALVPTKTRNTAGEVIDVQPLLDHHVTIPPGTWHFGEIAGLMAKQLSQQTGLHVSCCQAAIGGVPWGMGKITFEAHDKPAREVLKELIRLEDEINSESPNRHPHFDHWTVGCDGTGAPWCFIEVKGKHSGPCLWQ